MKDLNLTDNELRYIKLAEKEKAIQKDDELPTLTQKLDYLKDIKPYRIIQLISGVGSGKNFWAGTLIEAGFRVLLITSRKATANAQSGKYHTARRIDLEEILNANDPWNEDDSKFRNVICTNTGIEKYAKFQVEKGNTNTYLWNYFDFIIIDEVHSLTMDATYSDSPFYVETFIKHCYRHNKNLKIILMTGTPEPVEWLMPDEEKNDNFKCLDFRNECKHVFPKNVVVGNKDNAILKIINSLNKGEKVIYFANLMKNIDSLYEDLKKFGVSENEIFISHSKNVKSEVLSEEQNEQMKELQKYLEKKEVLPEGIKVLLTTSVSKEGININDENVKLMVSESHIKTDLIQMSGRVRKGLDCLFIIENSFQHSDNFSAPDSDICKICLKSIKEYSKDLFSAYGKEEIIKKIENDFKYIKYSVFKDNFMLYKGKIEGDKIAHESKYEFNSCLKYWDKDCFYIKEDDAFITGKMNFQKWFPESEVSIEKQYIDYKEMGISVVDNYIERKGLEGVLIEGAEIEKIIDDLNNIISVYQKLSVRNKKPYAKLGKLLNVWSNYKYKGIGDNNTISGTIVKKDD